MLISPGPLQIKDAELRDLVSDHVPLVEATSGRPTGITLTRLLGVGGMSTVFQAEVDPLMRSADLWDRTPRHVAIKIMKPATVTEIKNANTSIDDIFKREVIALSRVMERVPPTEFVVGCYGSGFVDVALGKTPLCLPWIAIELVSGGVAGVSLTARVEREPNGIDPVRALRLVRGIVEGVRVLHSERIIHRDLKPDNVLVVGPVDDETPKLSDCGIARVEGIASTVAGMTYAYGAPEQVISSHGQRNPLIGVWTDVHALAAVVWFILGGEDWCRSDHDSQWGDGKRRTLRQAKRTHHGFRSESELFDRIDAVLKRGAAPKLPAAAWTGETKRKYEPVAQMLLPALLDGIERYDTVDAFTADLFPLLEEVAEKWKKRAKKERRAHTTLRSSSTSNEIVIDPVIEVSVHPLRIIIGPGGSVQDHVDAANRPVMAAFQPDGHVLAMFDHQLLSIRHEEAAIVPVKPNMYPLLSLTQWIVRAPIAGFALVGPAHILLVGRTAEPVLLDLPRRERGGQVGPIVGVVGDGHVFGVVTSSPNDNDTDLELWTSEDGVQWSEPDEVPLGGAVRAMAYGPYGFLVVGGKRGGSARALYFGHDGICRILSKRIGDKPPLLVACAGVERDCWAAGKDYIVRLNGETAETEDADPFGIPIAMCLDVVGTPWLVTEDVVLRRHGGGTSPHWVAYHRRTGDNPPLVTVGFTPAGTHVLDAAGTSTLVVPYDAQQWG